MEAQGLRWRKPEGWVADPDCTAIKFGKEGKDMKNYGKTDC